MFQWGMCLLGMCQLGTSPLGTFRLDMFQWGMCLLGRYHLGTCRLGTSCRHQLDTWGSDSYRLYRFRTHRHMPPCLSCIDPGNTPGSAFQDTSGHPGACRNQQCTAQRSSLEEDTACIHPRRSCRPGRAYLPDTSGRSDKAYHPDRSRLDTFRPAFLASLGTASDLGACTHRPY